MESAAHFKKNNIAALHVLQDAKIDLVETNLGIRLASLELDDTTQTLLDAEESNRFNADSLLQTQIDTEKGRVDNILNLAANDMNTLVELTTHFASEDNVLSAAITSLTTEHNDELSAEATTARSAEQANAAAITSEASTSRAAEQANAAAITSEASTARAAEQANAALITSEATTARTAEQANAATLAALQHSDLSNSSSYSTTSQITTARDTALADYTNTSGLNTLLTGKEDSLTHGIADTNTLRVNLGGGLTDGRICAATSSGIQTYSKNETRNYLNIITETETDNRDAVVTAAFVAADVVVTNAFVAADAVVTAAQLVITNALQADINQNESDADTAIALKQDKLDGTHLHLHSGGSLVGVGTDSPNADSTLTIHGSGRHGVLALQDNRSQAIGQGGGIQFRGIYNAGTGQTVFASIKAKKENGTAGHYGSHLELQTRANGTGDVEVGLTVTSSQNVEVPGTLTVTGTIAGPCATQSAGNNTTQIASTAFVTAAVAAGSGGGGITMVYMDDPAGQPGTTLGAANKEIVLTGSNGVVKLQEVGSYEVGNWYKIHNMQAGANEVFQWDATGGSLGGDDQIFHKDYRANSNLARIQYPATHRRLFMYLDEIDSGTEHWVFSTGETT